MAQQTTQLLLRLRISPEIPFLTAPQERWIIQEFEDVIAGGAQLVKLRIRGEQIVKLVGTNKIAYLRKPAEQNPDWHYDLILIRDIEEDERRLSGEHVAPESVLFPSRHKPSGGRKSVAVVNCCRFEALPSYVQSLINVAWKALKEGRTVRSIWIGNGVKIFLLTAHQDTPQLAHTEEQVSETLQISEIGYVSSDQYEILQAQKLLNFRDTVKRN